MSLRQRNKEVVPLLGDSSDEESEEDTDRPKITPDMLKFNENDLKNFLHMGLFFLSHTLAYFFVLYPWFQFSFLESYEYVVSCLGFLILSNYACSFKKYINLN